MIKSVNPLSSPMAPGPLFILGSIFLCGIVVGEVNKSSRVSQLSFMKLLGAKEEVKVILFVR